MRFFEKRPFKEIAEIKESNESAVKMKVYRLLDKLKGIMEKK
jgi:RNA polymerase sigma-70 factor (ECF subfamily)